jgi:TPR repeat protein
MTDRDEAQNPDSLFLQAERYEEAGQFKSAFNRLLTAARMGHTSSQINVGNFYAEGKGTAKNANEASRWYREAYKNGHRSGAFNLATDLKKRGKARSAMIWFKKAISMKDGSAYLELAKMHSARRGGKKIAADLLQQALLLGPDNISDDDKEEAVSLLQRITIPSVRGK